MFHRTTIHKESHRVRLRIFSTNRFSSLFIAAIEADITVTNMRKIVVDELISLKQRVILCLIGGIEPCIVITNYLEGAGQCEINQFVSGINIICSGIADVPFISGCIVLVSYRFEISVA